MLEVLSVDCLTSSLLGVMMYSVVLEPVFPHASWCLYFVKCSRIMESIGAAPRSRQLPCDRHSTSLDRLKPFGTHCGRIACQPVAGRGKTLKYRWDTRQASHVTITTSGLHPVWSMRVSSQGISARWAFKARRPAYQAYNITPDNC